MHDGVLRTLQAFVGALNQFGATLHQHLNCHVIGNEVFFNDLANEVEVGLACGREAHFNFLEAHVDQCLEHAHLALGVHGFDESLIAVAQVDTAPQRCFLNHSVWPCAVFEHEWNERLVLIEGHLLRCHVLWRHWVFLCWVLGGQELIRRNKKPPALGRRFRQQRYAAAAVT